MTLTPQTTGGSKLGDAVVHFEVTGKDAKKLHTFFSELFGWEIDADNPMGYGVVQRDGNTDGDGVGIGGGIGPLPGGGSGHVTFYVAVADVEAALAKAESLGGSRLFGPDKVPGTDVELGQFTDPEGHVIGLMRS